MAVDIHINFQGNCREAMDFYAQVFGAEIQSIMTWGDMPVDSQNPLPEEIKSLVMHATLPIWGSNVMFGDVPPGMEFTVGNNITLTIGSKSVDEITMLFEKMKEGGQIVMPLEQTFFSKWYGSLVDKYGIRWQFVYDGLE